MGFVARSHSRWHPFSSSERYPDSEVRQIGGQIAKYRLTFLFAITAMVVIAFAAVIADHIVGGLSEKTVVDIVEDSSAREEIL